jgi:hypothetical protein
VRNIVVTDGRLTLEPDIPDVDHAVAAIAIYRRTLVDALTVRWTVGSASSAAGATLYGWNGLEWQGLATGGGALFSPSAVIWNAASPAEAAEYILGSQRVLTLVMVPNGTAPTPAEHAQVHTDYVEIETSYRLP